MYWFPVLSVLAVVPLGHTTPTSPRWDDMRSKHSWDSIPEKWECQGHPPSGTVIDLHVALKPHRENSLIDALYEVSDPGHSKYGAHLSKEQVAELVAPHPDTLELVGAWLEHHEVPSSSFSITHGGGWLTIYKVPLIQANALLGAEYQLYRHTETNETIIRTTGYALPASLHDHVQTVAPTTYFGSSRAHRLASNAMSNGPTLPNGDREMQNSSATPVSRAQVPSNCSDLITPTCLRLLYKTMNYVPQATSTNALGVTGFIQDYASHSDLTVFLTLFRNDADLAQFSVVEVNGSTNDQSLPGMEANLDIQYALSISFPTPNTFYSIGGSPPYKPDYNTPTNTNEPYLDWLNFILNQSTIPQTICMSYGDDEQTVPPEYAKRVCDMFAQLGAMGVSILVPTGDSGVGGGSCQANDGTNEVKFIPVFPASCPFVTAVGGTAQVNPEVAAYISGGGFSDYFSRPSYQNGAVSSYLQGIGTLNSGLFNTSGRGYPDISTQSTNFQMVISRAVWNTTGTSCSAPTAAGIISLLNDFRISNNKPPLGFLNPLIYTTAAASFNDITSGSNPACGTSGFPTATGWDPVTGLGTPDFEKLQGIVG